MFLLRNDFIGELSKLKDCCTAVELIGEDGECRLKLFKLEELPFFVEFGPFSMRGYQQGVTLSESQAAKLDMTGAVTRWNWRIPENGSIHFCKTREERDSNLIGDLG